MCQAGHEAESQIEPWFALYDHSSTPSSPTRSTIQPRSFMADNKTDASNSQPSDDLGNPTKGGLSAKPEPASQPAGAEPRLDTRFHRTFLVADVP